MNDNLGTECYHLLAEALSDTAAALNSAKNLDEVFESLLENVSRAMPHDTADILLIDPHGVAHVKVSRGYETMIPGKEELVYAIHLPVKLVPNLQQMAETRLPCLIDDLDEFQWVQTESTPWAKSQLGAPILVKGKAEGFLVLLSSQKGFFTQEQTKQIQSFADLAAIAMDKAHLSQKLNELATTDPLTEIANRRHFFNQAEIELARAQRYDRPLSALMVDIDHFKRVNDTYGHNIGDQVLLGVAQRCQRVIRRTDLLGRYGGEEFAIILPETAMQEGKKMSERLRQAIAEQPFETLLGSIEITVSIGLAGSRGGVPSARSLLDLADKALTQAKLTGRNRVVALD
jgi:diguanylate cyclase (GGDEF)-like protein